MRLLMALWLCTFAGTWHGTFTMPTVACDGSPEPGPLTPLLTVKRCDGRDTTFALPSRMPGQDVPFDWSGPDGHVYGISARLRDQAGNLGCGTQELWFAFPAVATPPPDTTTSGIAPRFFVGTTRGGMATVGPRSAIDYYWLTGSPIAGIPADQWSAEFIGKLLVATSGVYTIYLKSEDGGQVFIDGTLLINRYGVQPLTEWSANVTLMAGEHALWVYYMANNGNSECHVSWSGPGVMKSVIPRGALK